LKLTSRKEKRRRSKKGPRFLQWANWKSKGIQGFHKEGEAAEEMTKEQEQPQQPEPTPEDLHARDSRRSKNL
jgi:hypothetical protein